jgi:aminoglycoside 3'-phosphotransferase-1
MTDPTDAVAVGSSLLGWARGQQGDGVAFTEAPAPILGGLDTFIYALRFTGARDAAWNGPLILRLYPNAGRGESARREAAILGFLAERAFPAPAVVAAEEGTEVFGLPFVLMERVPGRTALERIQAKPQRAPAILDSLAALQARLHRVDGTGWPIDPAPGAPSSEVDRRLAAAADLRLEDDGLQRALEWLRANAGEVRGEDPVLCHYDLHPMNVLLADDGAAAVIDWEGAGPGDRHSDLARSLVLFAWGPAVASSPFERRALRALLPWMVRRWRRAYERHLPVDPAPRRYWMAFHAADSWLEAATLLSGTFERGTRTETREAPAVLVGPAMARMFGRLVPEA